MRKQLRTVAYWLGVSTAYHVAASYKQDSHIGMSVISMTVRIRPWLHDDNYRELMDYIKSQAVRAAEMPSITSITKLGA